MGESENESENESESGGSKQRVRPIVQLGIFLISHSNLFSVVCLAAGIMALLLLPLLAKNTYISENALMPGSANNMLSTHHVSHANQFINHLTDSHHLESQNLIAQYMSALDAEVTYHKFYPQLNQFHPLHFFTSPDSGIVSKNISCSSLGTNIAGIIRAPRGDGKEAIVLVTPYNPKNVGPGEALSLGIAYSVFSLLSRVTWLAKDVIWLVADSQYGEYSAVDAWLREYQAPVFHEVDMVSSETCNGSNAINELGQNPYLDRKLYSGFRRTGTVAAALVIKVTEQDNYHEDSLNIYAEVSNGQMPNLDLINIVNYVAVHWVQVAQYFGTVLENLWDRLLEAQIPATEYVEGAATLASSLYYQGLGFRTGPHGAICDYQVDAITLEISPKVSPNKMIRRNSFSMGEGFQDKIWRSGNGVLISWLL